MRCQACALLFVAFWWSVAQGQGYNVFLINITIFQRHEAQFPFSTNYPEVYLSCNDNRPRVDLDNVRRTDRLYQYDLGDVIATYIRKGRCVDCSLKEDDASPLLGDDTFGSWTMCQTDFEETGTHRVSHPDEFVIDFQCPNCTAPVKEPIEVEPPMPDVEIEAPPSMEPEDEETMEEESDVGTYYVFVESSPSSTPRRAGRVRLQSEPVATNEHVPVNNSAPAESESSGGMSVTTVLLLCFSFLVVGVVVGVALLWKFASNRQRPTYEAVELAKFGFIMDKAKGKF